MWSGALGQFTLGQEGESGGYSLPLSLRSAGQAKAKLGENSVAVLRQTITAGATMRSGFTLALAMKSLYAGMLKMGLPLTATANLVAMAQIIGAQAKASFAQTLGLSMALSVTAQQKIYNQLHGNYALSMLVTASAKIQSLVVGTIPIFFSMFASAKGMQSLTGIAPLALRINAQTKARSFLQGALAMALLVTGSAKAMFTPSNLVLLALRVTGSAKAASDFTLAMALGLRITAGAKIANAWGGAYALVMQITAQAKGAFQFGFLLALHLTITAMAKFGIVQFPQGEFPLDDLDQGGVKTNAVKVWRGPTLGHQMVYIEPELFVTSSPVLIGAGNANILVNFAGPCAITLPEVSQWVQDNYDIGRNRANYDGSITVKDLFGNAGVIPITIFGYGSQTIDNNLSIQITTAKGVIRMIPRIDLTGWVITSAV